MHVFYIFFTGGQSVVTIGPGGRVLSTTLNGTGTVCSDRWDDADADVLCRQMGFPSGTASYLPRDYMYNRFVFNVRCNGNESNVQQCQVDHSDMFGNCHNLGDAGVNCNNISQSEYPFFIFTDTSHISFIITIYKMFVIWLSKKGTD